MSSNDTEQSTTKSGSFVSEYRYLNEQEKQINDDYEWCLHDLEVRRRYGEQVVVVHQRRIWGAGADHLAAWTAALQQPSCPHRRVVAFVVVPPLDSRADDASSPET